jgi:hypothetical protein
MIAGQLNKIGVFILDMVDGDTLDALPGSAGFWIAIYTGKIA